MTVAEQPIAIDIPWSEGERRAPMSQTVQPPRDGQRPSGSGDAATVDGESSSLRIPCPRGTDAHMSPEWADALTDSRDTSPTADVAAPDPRTGDPTLSLVPDVHLSVAEHGALLRGPWQATSLSPAQTLTESIVESVGRALVVLDADLRVRLANRAFCRAFQVRL